MTAPVGGYGPASASGGLRASPYDRPGGSGVAAPPGGLQEYQPFNPAPGGVGGPGPLRVVPMGGQGGGAPGGMMGQHGMDSTACQFFLKAGWCKFGNACRFAHIGGERGAEAFGGPGGQVCLFFQKAGWCKWGDTCRHAHPGAVPGATPTMPMAGAPQSAPGMPPGGPMQGGFREVCQFYQKAGWCRWGDTCRYAHKGPPAPGGEGYASNGDYGPPQPFGGVPGQPSVCKYFQMPGGCRLGETCKFLHTGTPGQPEVCNFFAREGWCKFAETCKYIHAHAGPGPASASPQGHLQARMQEFEGLEGLDPHVAEQLMAFGDALAAGAASSSPSAGLAAPSGLQTTVGGGLGEPAPVGAGLAAAFEGLAKAIAKVAAPTT